MAAAVQSGGTSALPSADGNVARALVDLLAEGVGGTGEPGFQGLMGLFEKAGLKTHFRSWMTRKPNLSVGPADLHKALAGSGIVEDLLRRTALPEAELLERLAIVLPRVVREVTPFGEDDRRTVQMQLQFLRKRLRV